MSIGVKQAQEALRTALAMGADRAILIEAASDVHVDIEPLAVAKLLKGVVDGEGPGLVLRGKQAIDNDMNATGQILSALLGWPQGTFCSEVAIEGDAAVITCEVDGSPQTLNVAMPAVPTVDLRLNETKTTLAHSMPTGARLSRAFSPLDGTTFLSGEVAAVLHWRRENGDEDYNHLLHRDAWEVVLPELVFEAGVGAVMADQNGS